MKKDNLLLWKKQQLVILITATENKGRDLQLFGNSDFYVT